MEVCALRVSPSSLTHLTVLTVYRSPTGDFNIFLQNIDRVLKLISKHPVNIILTGDFNVNFMAKSKKRDRLISLLESYNLKYIVTFPTRITAQSSSTIDNIFIDSNRYNEYTITPFYNGLSDHDALMLTIHN